MRANNSSFALVDYIYSNHTYFAGESSHIWSSLNPKKWGAFDIVAPRGWKRGGGGGGGGGKLPAPASFIPADMWSFSTHIIVYCIWKII